MALGGVAWLLSACVPSEAPPEAAHSILGSWQRAAPGGCSESVTFQGDGRYNYRLALLDGIAVATREMAGQYTGGSTTAVDGTLTVRLTPDGPWPDSLPSDCDEWRRDRLGPLPTADAAAAIGFDPLALDFHSITLPDGRWAWVGADPALERQRFALVRDGTELRGFALAAPVGPDWGLFHREPRVLLERYPIAGTVPVVNLPQQLWGVSTGPITPGSSLGKVLLSVHQAVEVVFFVRPGPAPPPLCTLFVWPTYDYQGLELMPNPLAGATDGTEMVLNPADPDSLLVTTTHVVDGQAETLYLLPLEYRAPGPDGACEVNIRARPLAGASVQAQLALPSEGEPLRMLLGEASVRLLAHATPATPGLGSWPAAGFGGVAGVRLTGDVLRAPVVPGGLLHGADGAPREVTLSIADGGGGSQLNVYPVGAITGLGPLHRPPPVQEADLLEAGVAMPVALAAGDPPAAFALDLGVPTLLTLYSSGNVRTAATLAREDGVPLALAQGGAAEGAPDGIGFRMVLAAEPGRYRLTVTADVLPASFTVHRDPLTGQGLPDAALEACLLAATPEGMAPDAVRAADCTGRGVTSLAGIGAYPRLARLRLDGAAVTDLAPLSALLELGALSLARTGVTDWTPLADVLYLHTLSVADTTLDAAAIAAFGALAGRLRVLDLTGAQGVTAEELGALQASMPGTRIIAPDGMPLP